jgi:hypothetical protein
MGRKNVSAAGRFKNCDWTTLINSEIIKPLVASDLSEFVARAVRGAGEGGGKITLPETNVLSDAHPFSEKLYFFSQRSPFLPAGVAVQNGTFDSYP